MNPYLQRKNDFRAHVKNNVAEGVIPPRSGFFDAWQAATGLFIDENLSISRFLNQGVREERNQSIDKLLSDGSIPADVASAFTHEDKRARGPYRKYKIDYNGLAEYVNKSLDVEVQTDEELDESIRDTLKQRREYTERVLSRTSTSGTIGSIAGGFTGVALDPINVASFMATPYRAMKGLSILQNVLRAGGKEALIGAAAETAIQPFVLDWKAEIQSPYTPVEAIQNIGFAAGFGFALGGIGGGINAVRGRNTNTVKTQDFKVSDMQRELDTVIDQASQNIDVISRDPAAQSSYDDLIALREDLNDADPDMQAADHFDNIHKQLSEQGNDGPRYRAVDFGEFDDTRLDLELAELGDVEMPVRMDVNENREVSFETETITNVLTRADEEAEKLTTLRACILG